MNLEEIKLATQKIADELLRVAKTIAHCKLDDYDVADNATLNRIVRLSHDSAIQLRDALPR
jgi:hypothetical protein